MAQLQFLYNIFCQTLIFQILIIKILFTLFRKNGGSKIRDNDIFANFIIFFNRSGWGKIWFGSVQNEGLRKQDTQGIEKKYKNCFFKKTY